MKVRSALFLCAAVLALAGLSGFDPGDTLAQGPARGAWSSLQAISLQQGSAVGFFDTSSGRLYVYDLKSLGPDLTEKKPLATLWLSELGQPLRHLTPPRRPE